MLGKKVAVLDFVSPSPQGAVRVVPFPVCLSQWLFPTVIVLSRTSLSVLKCNCVSKFSSYVAVL